VSLSACKYIHTHIHANEQTHIHIKTRTNMHRYIHTNIQICIRIHTSTHRHINAYTYTHTHTCMHTFIHTNTRRRTRTNPHFCKRPSVKGRRINYVICPEMSGSLLQQETKQFREPTEWGAYQGQRSNSSSKLLGLRGGYTFHWFPKFNRPANCKHPTPPTNCRQPYN